MSDGNRESTKSGERSVPSVYVNRTLTRTPCAGCGPSDLTSVMFLDFDVAVSAKLNLEHSIEGRLRI